MPSDQTTPRPLFSHDPNRTDWQAINDGVMGGVSLGACAISPQGTLVFSGVLSLENNGGFASIRSLPKALGLSDDSILVFSALGDGREYSVNLYPPLRRPAFSYRQKIQSTQGQWVEFRLRVGDFVPTHFGRLAPEFGPIPSPEIVALGFMLSDKRPGPFRLEIARIDLIDEERKSI